MNLLRSFITLAILMSLSANAYFYWDWSKGRGPVVVSPPSDDRVVLRTEGGLLEVTRIRSPEQFTSTNDHAIFGVFPIGSTTSRIRVPAVYRYHIELAREWKILVRDKTFIVVAPAVKPSLPVAIDTAKLTAETSGVWSLIAGGPLLAQLQQSITSTLDAKAASPSYINFQREAARATVKEFVAKWLITQEQWKAASSYSIQVFFADEPIQSLRAMPQPFAGSL